MDKKLTDNEIIKALEQCAKGDCKICVYYGNSHFCIANNVNAVLDLINRLQAENDNYSHNNRTMTKDILDLQKENEELRVTIKAFTDIGKMYSEIKAEAYKECIEKVKEKANKFKWREDSCEPFIIEYRIGEDNLENLLKELVGGSQ